MPIFDNGSPSSAALVIRHGRVPAFVTLHDKRSEQREVYDETVHHSLTGEPVQLMYS